MDLQSYPILADSFRTAGSLNSAMSGQLDDEDSSLAQPLLHEEGGEAGSVSKPLAPQRPGPSPLGRSSSGAEALPTLHSTLLEDSPSATQGSGLLVSIIILAKTIMGAGMAALPRAFIMLGALFAGGFLLLIAYMNHWSVDALTLGTAITGHMSYPEVVRVLCGRRGALLLQLSLVFRCAGLLIVYIIITADVLAGHPGAPGLVCDLLGSAAGGWCANRALAAGVVAVLFMAPLITPKRLSSTALTSWLGLAAVTVWVGVTVTLVIVALAKGMAHPIQWLPDLEAFSGGRAQVAVQIVGVIPVLATAYTCQMTIHFIIRDLRPFSERRVSIVSAAAAVICTVMFLTVALGSQVAFGQDIPADVLTEFNAGQLSRFVAPCLARVLYVAVRLGFLLSVVTIFPMQMAPYRESLSRLIAGTELSGPPYYLLTYGSLALLYWIAMHAGSIWVPIQFVGATAGALIAFIFPAWVALEALRRQDPGALAAQRYWRWNAYGLVALGIVQAVAGVTTVILNGSKPDSNSSGGSPLLSYLF
ncbi:hypothetical protein ABPG77_002509 [Micractinium sp. CCAP 211/92]